MSELDRAFEDLVVGESFVSRGRTITEADVVFFSALTGDWHPQHADATWSAQSPFGERVAHGMLVLAYAVGLVELDPRHVVALRRVASATFKAPVRIGETIHVEGRIAELSPLDEQTGLAATDWKVVRDDGRTAARMRIEAIWRRREPAASVDGAGAKEVTS